MMVSRTSALQVARAKCSCAGLVRFHAADGAGDSPMD